MAKRKGLSKGTRFRVMQRDNFRCQYCGLAGSYAPLVIDHMIPVRLGGTNNPDNLLTACIPCNQGKAAHSLIEPVRMKPVHTNTYAPVVFWRYLTKNEATSTELTDQQIEKLRSLASKYGSLWVTSGMCYLKRQFGFSLPVDLSIELVEHKAAHGFLAWGLLESLSWQKLEVISAQGWFE